jgi:multimeric flavodoxin WrbA
VTKHRSVVQDLAAGAFIMKIMVLSALYPPNSPGGAEKSVALIAEGLAARGHDVSAVTLHDESTETETIEGG